MGKNENWDGIVNLSAEQLAAKTSKSIDCTVSGDMYTRPTLTYPEISNTRKNVPFCEKRNKLGHTKVWMYHEINWLYQTFPKY